MIEKFISPGDKVEMKSTVNVVLPDGTKGIKTYKSSVYDILDEGRLEIVMPKDRTKLVLLPVDGEYDVCFYTHGGMYRADVRIIEIQKINGIYVLVTEMISNLHKYQRREYYRFNCIIEMMAREMTKKETDIYAEGLAELLPQSDMIRGVIVDISGGGARFVSRQLFRESSMILMRFELPILDTEKSFLLVGRVIYSSEIVNRANEFENRVKFELIDSVTREKIIRYIFNEERKNRKK